MSASRAALRELDLGPEPRPANAALGGVAPGAVVAGSIVAFQGAVSSRHRRDVLQSLLLAQLAANAKANRHREALKWYKTYQSTLESVGWVVSGSPGFTQFVSQVNRFTIGVVITDTFRPAVTPEGLTLIGGTLRDFVRNPASPAQFVWECPSHSGGLGNFQFGLATEDDTLQLQVGRYILEASQHVTRLALEDFGRDAKFLTSIVGMTLNEELYDQLRPEIEKRLATRFEASVADVDHRPP